MKFYQLARFVAYMAPSAAICLLRSRLIWWEMALLWLSFVVVYLCANLENNWEREGY